MLLEFMAEATMVPSLWSWQEAMKMMWYAALSLCVSFQRNLIKVSLNVIKFMEIKSQIKRT